VTIGNLLIISEIKNLSQNVQTHLFVNKITKKLKDKKPHGGCEKFCS